MLVRDTTRLWSTGNHSYNDLIYDSDSRWSNSYSRTNGFRSSSNYNWFNEHSSAFKEVDLHCETNNYEHHTSEISLDKLIVRRGQPFNITLKMAKPFNPDVDQLTMGVETGKYPSEERGTRSSFGLPNRMEHSSSAKAVWQAELQKNGLPERGILPLTIIPPANTPIGVYKLTVRRGAEEKKITDLTVLFNPWCSEDWVFLSDEAERQEYIMNQHGIIYTGSKQNIQGFLWEFGQFEEDMVEICMKILDLNIKHQRDPADDDSARCNPIYVSRVVSNMVTAILVGNWSNDFRCGYPPTYWSGSYAILKKWYDNFHKAVKFGQCWVYGGVICSVMRLLGIPCRVVTNYESAHDTNKNLIIESYIDENGGVKNTRNETIWNFHVWVEGWMKRPDLAGDGRYDGWQAIDGTPQERSEGLYRCGPAPVAAILNGDVDLKYDVPFVFAEVNADLITYMIRRDGSKAPVRCDNMSVGQLISTKAVGSNNRMDITNNYKHPERTEQERAVFQKARAKMQGESIGHHLRPFAFTNDIHSLNTKKRSVTFRIDEAPQLSIKFEEESTPVNGQDVNLRLVLRGKGSTAKMLSIKISIQAMMYTSRVVGNIQNEFTNKILLPGKGLIIPIQVPYSNYSKHMVNGQTMNISALITDQQNEDQRYRENHRVVLKQPPITLIVSKHARVKQKMTAKVVFMNPVNETLRDCTLTLFGTGLFYGEKIIKLPDLMPNKKISVKLRIIPYKRGERTFLVDFDCASFKNIKNSCIINVKP